MKNEIVTPAGTNGEAGRGRRFAALAVHVALASVGAVVAHAAHAASSASCDAQLTQLIVPALRQTAFDRQAIHAEPAALTGQPDGVLGVRLFVTPTVRARRTATRRSAGSRSTRMRCVRST